MWTSVKAKYIMEEVVSLYLRGVTIMGDLVLYLGITVVGYILGAKFRSSKDRLTWTGKVQIVAITVLVFVMGLRIGANKEVVENLSSIGIYAVVFTLAVMAATVVCISIVRRIMGIDRFGLMKDPETNSAIEEESTDVEDIIAMGPNEAAVANTRKVDPMTIVIICFVTLGISVGYFVFGRIVNDFDVFNNYCSLMIKIGLCTLLIFVGLDLGLDGKVVTNFKKVGIRIMAIPAAAIVGTMVGSALCALFLPISLRESLAIGAGFGWYSLAPGIIMDKGFLMAGAISFMHNVMRELFAIITIPFVARHVGYVESCGLPGASAMDVCLPIVERSTSSNTAVYSFVTGLVLSIAVPIMVPILI